MARILCGWTACQFNSSKVPGTKGTCNCTGTVELIYADEAALETSSEVEALVCNNFGWDEKKVNNLEETSSMDDIDLTIQQLMENKNENFIARLKAYINS